ncbi:cytochrome c [Candidatus Pelagibacter sp.]|nr:cytochrome c [Candidatus Pelagibacter sp.]
MKILLIIISFIFINQISYAYSHFPITRDSTLMIARGKIIYENNCVSCHQVNLSGAENWQGLDNDGHRKAPPLNGTGHTWHHDDASLHTIIKYGLAKIVKNYEGKMIGFGDKINDKQIDSVLSYIKSHWEDEIYERQISISK